MEEIWKDIREYEGLYQASTKGRIKSLNYNHTNKEKILRPRKCSRYYKIALYKNGERKDFQIHRIIAETFIENKLNKKCVNHKDENTYNNEKTNLMWCTHKENMNWGTRNKRISQNNINNPKKMKRILQYNKNGEFIKEWESEKQASEKLNISQSHITACCKNKYGRKTVGGYKWKYAIDTHID